MLACHLASSRLAPALWTKAPSPGTRCTAVGVTRHSRNSDTPVKLPNRAETDGVTLGPAASSRTWPATRHCSTTASSSTHAAVLRVAAKQLGIPIGQIHRDPHLYEVILQVGGCAMPLQLAALAATLHLDQRDPALLAVVKLQPAILLQTPASMQQQAHEVAAAMRLSAVDTALLLQDAPAVLLQRDTCSNVLAALRHALAGAVQHDKAIKLALKHPQVLARHSSDVTELVAVLRQALCLDAALAWRLLNQEPALLSCSAASLRLGLATVQSSFRLLPEQLQEVALHCPELLSQSPGPLKVRHVGLTLAEHAATDMMAAGSVTCDRLLLLMQRSEAWQKELPTLLQQPRNLAVALTFDSGRYERLTFLVKTHRDLGIGFKEALSMMEEDFNEMYPGFANWRHKQGR